MDKFTHFISVFHVFSRNSRIPLLARDFIRMILKEGSEDGKRHILEIYKKQNMFMDYEFHLRF